MTRRLQAFLLAAGLLCGAAPLGAQVVCADCAAGGGLAESTDPVTATGVWTFDNAANTAITAADGLSGPTLQASTSSCAAGAPDAANSVCLTANTITGEGATADAFETLLAFGNATADSTLTLTGGSSGRMLMNVGGFDYFALGSAQLQLGSATYLLWMNGSTTTSSTSDTGLLRSGAGSLQVVSGFSGATIGSLMAAISVETVATTKAPAVAESAELYTNGADTDGQAITLPNDPTVGVCYEFALTATDASGAFVIAPNTGETLRQGAVTCGTSYSAVAIGSTSRICAVAGGSGGVWQVMYDAPAAAWTCTP